MQRLARYPVVLEQAQHFPVSVDALTELCVAVQQISAPTGAEGARAAWVEERFRTLNLHDVRQDALANVIACVPGESAKPGLMISAHTDTVFASGTDLRVRYEMSSGRVYGPGIGDNAAGVAALLALADVIRKLPKPPVNIWLVANTGEEGLGDLRGMRAAIDALGSQIGACIVLEGMGLGRVVHRALGSRRYRIRVEAPGGHSWSDFGTASALHILVKLAADLTQLRIPETPRTTFNIGRLEGGTSVNSIAQRAWLELDLRSEETSALQGMIDQVMATVAIYQNPKWERRGVVVRAETIGDRPPGEIPASHPLVLAAQSALAAIGHQGKPDLRISSTDANIPLSRGIPAVCVGVTEGGNAHRVQEWIQTAPLGRGMSHLLLLTWWAADWLANEG